jgi:hypothetical protein
VCSSDLETGPMVVDHMTDNTVTINLSCDCRPLSMSDSGSGVIYRTDSLKVNYGLLNIGAATAVAPITATLVSGQVPTGMSINLTTDSKSLNLDGIPETEGNYRFSVKVKDSCPLERSETRDFNVSVRCGTMQFATPQKLPDAVIKKPYTANILTTCNGSYENLRYELLGELPAGLTLSPSGLISGTPVEEKESYFYVSVTGQERGAAKEIHQRFDLITMREVPIIAGGKSPEKDGNSTNPITLSPEISGVPSSCHPEDTLTISYKGITPLPGLKMGLFSEKETGFNPTLGWKAVLGSSGTLTFNAPANPGRYLFRIFDQNGKTVLNSSVFSSMKKLDASTLAPGTDRPLSVNSPSVSTPIKASGDMGRRLPAVNCADTLLIKGMQGYQINECVKRFDEGVIMISEDPDSATNLRYEGEKTTVNYAWASEGPSPSLIQIKRYFSNEAKRLGATVIVDRQNYTALKLTRSGNMVYVSVVVYNDGRTVDFMAIEPEVEN